MPTKIPWVINPDGTQGSVLNVVSGCTPISEGCAHCYAKRLSPRLKGRFGYPEDDPFRVTLHEDKLKVPYAKAKPTTFFLCSMGDLFHKNVAEKYILDVFEMMIENSRHTFLILTKRPKRLLESPELIKISKRLPLYPHIWMGVSVENQKTADERIQILYQIPAAKRFVSCEPLLSSLDLKIGGCNHCQRFGERLAENGHWKNPCSLCGRVRNRNLDWIICGGENGPGARPMHTDWARSLRDQCVKVGVPFFFKQWGEWMHSSQCLDDDLIAAHATSNRWFNDDIHFAKIGKKTAGHLLDGVFHRQVPWGEFG